MFSFEVSSLNQIQLRNCWQRKEEVRRTYEEQMMHLVQSQVEEAVALQRTQRYVCWTCFHSFNLSWLRHTGPPFLRDWSSSVAVELPYLLSASLCYTVITAPSTLFRHQMHRTTLTSACVLWTGLWDLTLQIDWMVSWPHRYMAVARPAGLSHS